MKIDDFINEVELHPLTAAIAIFIILFVIVRMKSSTTNNTAQQPAITTDTAQPPQVAEVYYQTYNSNPVVPGVPVTPTSNGTPGTIRSKQASGQFAGYDNSHTGVPYYSSPTTTAVGTIPYGTQITILQSGIKGVNHSNGGTYTQISWLGGTEYVSSQDIA